MAYVRVKKIKGIPYLYLQTSFRENGQVKTKHVKYIGGDGKYVVPKLNSKQRQVAGARLDKRSNKRIAQDIKTKSDLVYDDPKKWIKTGKNKSDLRNWDTPDIEKYRQRYVNIFNPMKEELSSVFKKEKIEGRVKTLISVVKKLKKKNVGSEYTQDDFEDIIGTRVTFDNEKDLKKAVVVMRKNFNVKDEEDYISNPKFGYRSYHFTVVKNGLPVEVQFRTNNMTKWADWNHDRLYDNVEETRKRLGDKGFKEAQKYSLEMSEYYAKKDKGFKNIKEPVVPKIVKEKLGGGME